MRFAITLFLTSLIFSFWGQDFSNIPNSGVYKNEVVIKPNSNQTIHYSTKGFISSETIKKLSEPLTISKTSCLLFRIKQDNWDTTFQRTYVFDYTSKLAVLSIAINPQDLWSDTSGIYVQGSRAIWNDSIGHWENCNYQRNWEKVIYASFIDTNNIEGFSQQCGIKIFGESTRRQPDKSLKIIARKDYGKGKFNYPVFPDKDINKYKQLVIRASGNDYNGTRFKDAMSAYLVRNMDIDYMAWRPINLFINGEYWGVYNLREKVNEHYIASNHDVKKDSANIIMGRWVRQQGSSESYFRMYNWFATLDTMNDAAYEKAQTMLNIRNYINYRVFQIFINNKDSRGNIRYYNVSGEEDMRFKMILYDTDLGYGKYSMNYLEKCISPIATDWHNPVWSTMYLSKLMQHPKFKNEFASQFAHLMNTSLHKDTLLAAIDYFENIYKDELPRTYEGRPSHLKKTIFPLEKWNEDVNSLRSYAKLRPKAMWQHLQTTLQLKGTYVLNFIGNSGWVSINDNYPIHLPFSGKYFKGIPLHIQMLGDEEFAFSSFKGIDSSLQILTNFTEDSISLTPIFYSLKKEIVSEVIHEPFEKVKEVIVEDNSYLYNLSYSLFTLGFVLMLLYIFWTKKME